MTNEYTAFEERKKDHIKLALMAENQAVDFNQLDGIHLVHEALPDLNFADVCLHSVRLNREVPKPFIVSSMTAGHDDAVLINRRLVEACSDMQWAMAVGSQRRELTDANAALEWQQLRRDFPEVSLLSNLGIAQVLHTPIDDVVRITDTLRADALIVHCNPLQECIQPEGTPQFKGCWQALEHLVRHMPLPVVVKETVCGFSQATLKRLNDVGVAAVDVSGLGGTHWGRIEGQRAQHDDIRHQAAVTFKNWGIDTVSCVKEAKQLNPQFEIWGSGGIRHGLDAAKLLALGATTVGFAKLLLAAAVHSSAHVVALMQGIEYELKVALFCTGSQTLDDLKEKIQC